MRDSILEELFTIERERGVRVLFAVESGSRAWGMASPDSDYDVRFVYARPEEGYLRLEEVRDTIEWKLDETYDIVGWDLCKFLRLMRGSNPTVFEWLESPIIYREVPVFAHVRSMSKRCHSRKASAFHYLGMAKEDEKRFSRGDTVSAKTYLYAVRAILSARWVLEEKTPAPMRIQDLVDSKLDMEMEQVVAGLLEAKAAGDEACEVPRITELERWIEKERTSLLRVARKRGPRKKIEWSELDELFLKVVRAE